MKLLLWEVYEVTSKNDLQGIMFRGRLRKFALSYRFNLLTENDEKSVNCVRYAILHEQQIDNSVIKSFIEQNLDKDTQVKCLGFFENPVLSKLKVNEEKRYSL